MTPEAFLMFLILNLETIVWLWEWTFTGEITVATNQFSSPLLWRCLQVFRVLNHPLRNVVCKKKVHFELLLWNIFELEQIIFKEFPLVGFGLCTLNFDQKKNIFYLWWLIVCIFYYYYFSSSSIRPNVLRWRTPCRQPRPLWSVKTTTKILRQRPLRTILRTILLYKKYESLEIRSGLWSKI